MADSVSCPGPHVCMEDASRYPEAVALYNNSLLYAAEVAGPFRNRPRIIFCSTESCFRYFGFDKASAATVGRSVIVVSPRGWKPCYIRHEMIHYRQAEEPGVLAMMAYPECFTEGMAYGLSGDPRKVLSETWHSHRNRFLSWLQKVGKDQVREEASRLCFACTQQADNRRQLIIKPYFLPSGGNFSRISATMSLIARVELSGVLPSYRRRLVDPRQISMFFLFSTISMVRIPSSKDST